MIENLRAPYTQARDERGLEHLLASRSDLGQQFKHFLIFCKVEGFSPHTIKNYKGVVGRFINHCQTELGINDASGLTAYHIRSYLLPFRERLKPYSFYDYFRAIKRFLNWLVSEGILAVSPMANMKPPRVPKTLIQPFQPGDLRKLLYLCDDKTFLGILNKAIIMVFLDTGLRLNELSKIQIEDVNFDRGIIKVMGKGAKERVVAIQQRTQKAVLRYLLIRKDTYRCLWVTEEHRPLSLRGVQVMIKRLGERAGLENVRCSPHTFRHTAATMMLDNGTGEFEVQAVLGHSTLSMTRRYVASLNSEKAAEAHKRFSPVEHLKLG